MTIATADLPPAARPSAPAPPEPPTFVGQPLPGISFVTVIEYGPLEIMGLRLIDSLRRWGGRMANAPVFAVKPRFGLPLKKATRRKLDELNVTFLDIRPKTRYPWFRFVNKPLAMIAAEARATTEQMCWLDADILITREPTGLLLTPDEDFTACASDKNVGTTGPGDEFEPFWVAAARAYGYAIDDLPWVRDERTGEPIRLYWNSGVFTYRTGAGFAQGWYDDTLKLLDAKLALKKGDLIFHEQIALGITMLRNGLRYRALPDLLNRPVAKIITHVNDPEKFRQSPVLHYHGCMWPDFFTQFLAMFDGYRPDIRDWLAPQGPVTYAPPVPIKAMKKVIDVYRGRQWNNFVGQCTRL